MFCRLAVAVAMILSANAASAQQPAAKSLKMQVLARGQASREGSEKAIRVSTPRARSAVRDTREIVEADAASSASYFPALPPFSAIYRITVLFGAAMRACVDAEFLHQLFARVQRRIEIQ